MPNLPIFAVEGCFLTDRISNRIPTFKRGSSVNLVSYNPKTPVTVQSVRDHTPAVYSDTGGILLEKAAAPLLNHNIDLSQKNLWIAGQYVNVFPNQAIGADGAKTADLIAWSAVTTGVDQSLSRTFSLVAEKTYTIAFLIGLQNKGGTFNESGEIRITGDVKSATPIKLSELNNSPGQYRYLWTTFKAAGKQPKLPVGSMTSGTGSGDYQVLSVTNNTITLQIFDMQANDLRGGQLQFDANDQSHTINGSSQSTNGIVTISTDTPSLAAFGVTTASRARILSAPVQTVTLTFYSEASATLMFGGCFLEEGDFPSSPLFTDQELKPRAQSICHYSPTPLQNLNTFGVFVHLDYWQGDGNIIQSGDFQIAIVSNRLTVTLGGTSVTVPQDLPRYGLKIFVQVAIETTSLSVYINTQLASVQTIPRYQAPAGLLVLTTEGVRVFKQIFLFDYLLPGGGNAINDFATGELLDLIANPELVIPSELITRSLPVLKLPPIEVPGMVPPKASSVITSLSTSSRLVTVSDITGFAVGDLVVVLRGEFQITWTTIRAIPSVSTGTIELENVAGINTVTDSLVAGNINEPGRASVRLPFDTQASGVVDTIDLATKSVRLTSSAVAFTAGRVFILTAGGQDIREAIVSFVDPANQRLVLSSVDDIRQGHLIVQPSYETEVSPPNYEVGFTLQVPGIRVGAKANNSFVVLNDRPNKAYLTPLVTVNL
jgi:hypothetical protein